MWLYITPQYFTIHSVVFVSITVKQFINVEILGYVISIFEAARMTVMFVPVLPIRFTRVRMRALPLALQLTKVTYETISVTAGSQNWVQDGMYFVT